MILSNSFLFFCYYYFFVGPTGRRTNGPSDQRAVGSTACTPNNIYRYKKKRSVVWVYIQILFTQIQTLALNKRIKRHGQRVRTFAERNSLYCSINSFIWGCISQSTADASLFLEDGLHLNHDGRKLQSWTWMREMIPKAPERQE